MARAVFNSSSGSAQGLDEFLQKHRPSEAEPRQYAWIQLNAPAAEYVEQGDSDGAEAAWLGTEEKSIARIDAIAARFGILEVHLGKLGHSAKISTSPEGGCYCVCVYTVDYRDATDVWRVRRELRDLGFAQQLYYKPDVYTCLGIYNQNPWRIPASRYKR